jgi:hypothetical protein
VAVDAPCGVSTLRTAGRRAAFEVAVADMEHGTGTLTVRVALPTGQRWKVAHADESVAVAFGTKEVTLTVRGDGTGNAHRVKLEV